MSEFVKYEDIDHIRVIRIDRPEKKNAVNDEMLLRISDLIEEVEGNSAIKCIIITSVTDKIFSSGYDISSENVDTKENILRVNIIDYSPNENSFQRISRILRNSEKITIASINGDIYGGTLEILLNCEFRFFSEDSIFSIPPVKLGIVYNYYGIRNFINKIGILNTRKIFLTGDRFNSEEAKEMGVIDFVSKKGSVLDDSIEFSKKFVSHAPLSISSIKKSINAVEGNQVIKDEVYDDIKASILKAINSEDYLEGQKAFKEKRKPNFSGK